METKRSREIRQEITSLDIQYAYTTSMIALLMSEANLIDQQIEGLTKSGLLIKDQLADLRAELKTFDSFL